MKFRALHNEILVALQELGDARLGVRIAKDRDSKLRYMGIRIPVLRNRVKQGFSFYDRNPREVLRIWDDLWMHSEWADVLFCAEEYYKPIVRQRAEPYLWPTMKKWVARVENWAHSDALSGLYSWILEEYPRDVLPQLGRWIAAGKTLWHRRVSIVSLIHYTGKNAAFLKPDVVLPLLNHCISDDRDYIQKGVGWVLREMWNVYPREIRKYVEDSITRMPAGTFSRAIEGLGPQERVQLGAIRRRQMARHVKVPQHTKSKRL